MKQKLPLIINLLLGAGLVGLIIFKLTTGQQAPVQPEPTTTVIATATPTATVSPEPSNTPIPGKKITERRGPFQIGSPITQKIFVDILYFKPDDPKQIPTGEGEEAIGMTVVSETGKILYREDYPGGEIDLYFGQIPLPNNKGAVLLITTIAFVSAEGTGWSNQFYCFRYNGSFGPVTNSLRLENYGDGEREGLETEAGEIIEYRIKGTTQFCYTNYPWTGNFNVVEYIPIYLNGNYKISPNTIKMDVYPVRIDEARAAKRRQDGTIHLYKSALLEAGVKTIKIRHDSKVRFLGTKYIAEKDSEKIHFYVRWWLHVIIDGEEGYIINRRELAVLGLSFMGRYDSDSIE